VFFTPDVVVPACVFSRDDLQVLAAAVQTIVVPGWPEGRPFIVTIVMACGCPQPFAPISTILSLRAAQSLRVLSTKGLRSALPKTAAASATREESHGRHEQRIYEVITEPTGIRDRQAWPKLQVIGKCYAERRANGKTTPENRYFIGSRS
jgi:hypothetical protein